MLMLTSVALLLATSPPSTAGASPPSFSAWSAFVQGKLGKAMRYPKRYGRADHSRDSVEIVFALDGSGRPTGAQVARTSSNAFTDAAALEAIERLGSLHPLPASIGGAPQLRAILFYPRGDEKSSGEAAVLRLQHAL